MKKDFPYIFAFYSFKGGVGRSLALINVAYELAGKGRHVLVLDLDIEAPGISGFLRRHKELDNIPEKDAIDLIKWARDIAPNLGQNKITSESDLPKLGEYAAPVKHEKIATLKPKLGDLGRLDVIAVNEDNDYYRRLNELDVGNWGREEIEITGNILREWLKHQRFDLDIPDYYGSNDERQVPYDYVLIDSRTGVTEAGGLCISPLSDRLVVFCGLNDQNIHGTEQFLKETGIEPIKPSAELWDAADVAPGEENAPKKLGPKPTLIVSSPVPAGEIDLKKERHRVMAETLGAVSASLSYHPRQALMETLFVRENDFAEEQLTHDYIRLTRQVMASIQDSPPQLAHQAQLEFEEDNPKDAIDYGLRTALADPDLGEALLKRLVRDVTPSAATYSKLDRSFRMLSAQHVSQRAVTYRLWGVLMYKWAEENTDPATRQQRLHKAIALYTELLSIEDVKAEEKAKVLSGRGLAKREMGDKKGCLQDCQKAVELAPHEAYLWFALACMEALFENLEGSVEALKKWKELEPEANRKKIDEDSDFDSIRKHPAFIDFREKLPPE